MNFWKQIAAAALGALVLLAASPATAGTKRPRPSDVPGAQTAVAPNDFQIFNDYASPERTYASRFVVVHYVVLGIDAPPLNDDDLDAAPDYVERVGDAADRALAYFEHRGFHAVLADTAGPDVRPDIYVSRFAPGTLGVAFPASRAEGGAFVVIANNLDPSAGRSFAANASGSPVWPYSPPKNPPWSPGNGVGSMPSRSAVASPPRWASSPCEAAPVAMTIRVGAALRASKSGS